MSQQQIQTNSKFILSKSFYFDVEKRENVPNIIYGDTDSIFIHLRDYKTLLSKGYSFDTEEDILKVDNELVQPFAKGLNNFLKEKWQSEVLDYLNVEEEHNTLEFKTEIVLDAIAFFDVKKKYFLNLIKEEKVVFTDRKIKITGLEAVRSDVARFTREMQMDIIKTFIEYRKVPEAIPEKYFKKVMEWSKKFDEEMKNQNLQYLGIPSSWSAREYKKEPSYVLGARFWNTFIKDEIRPGKKSVRLSIKFNKFKFPRIYQELKKKQQNGEIYPSDFQLDLTKKPFNTPSGLMEKIKFIFIPPGLPNDYVIKKLKEVGVEIDWKDQKNKIYKEKLELFNKLIQAIRKQ